MYENSVTLHHSMNGALGQFTVDNSNVFVSWTHRWMCKRIEVVVHSMSLCSWKVAIRSESHLYQHQLCWRYKRRISRILHSQYILDQTTRYVWTITSRIIIPQLLSITWTLFLLFYRPRLPNVVYHLHIHKDREMWRAKQHVHISKHQKGKVP